jgi:hypothetical protein
VAQAIGVSSAIHRFDVLSRPVDQALSLLTFAAS